MKQLKILKQTTIRKLTLIFAIIVLCLLICLVFLFFSTDFKVLFNEIKSENDYLYDFVITAVITIFISATGFSFKVVFQWLYNKIKYYKLNIQGSYFTEYQDYRDGKHVIIKERIYIEKKGLILSWKSDFGNQSWNFNGEIEGELLNGYYVSNAVLDSGKGSFLLKINLDNTLLGIWMGFSHVNKLISQGLYYLKKVPEILTENVSSSMRSKLAKIIFDTSKNFAFINKILLEKEGSLKAIAALGVESKNRNAKFINKKAYDNDTPILGVAIWLTDTLNEISQLLDVSKSFFPLYLDSATKCTLVIFLGVDEKYSNQGVEKVLVQEMLHPIKRENSEAVVVLLDKNNKKEQGAELLHLIRDNLLYAASGQSFIQSQDNEKEEINSELNPIIYGEEFSDVLLASGFDKVEPNSENIFHFDIFIKT